MEGSGKGFQGTEGGCEAREPDGEGSWDADSTCPPCLLPAPERASIRHCLPTTPSWLIPRCQCPRSLPRPQPQRLPLLLPGFRFTAVSVARASATARTFGVTSPGTLPSNPTRVHAVARASNTASTWPTTCVRTPASGPTAALPALKGSETPPACCTTRSSTLVRSPTAAWCVSSASPHAPAWAATSSASTAGCSRPRCNPAQACRP